MGKGSSYSRIIGFGGRDQMTVSTHTSYCERMGNAMCGSVLGLCLFFGGLGLIGWNEYRTIETLKIIEAGEESVLEGACTANATAGAPAPASHDGELVHVSCAIDNIPTLSAPGPTSGSQPWATQRGIWLGVHVEYYGKNQYTSNPSVALWYGPLLTECLWSTAWNEDESCSEHKEHGGGTTKVCTYKYDLQWMAESNIKEPNNPKDDGVHSNSLVSRHAIFRWSIKRRNALWKYLYT